MNLPVKKIIYFLVFIFSALTGCKTWNPAMLSTKNDPITPKLLTLEKKIEPFSNGGQSFSDPRVFMSDDELNLFTKEIENNLLDPYGEKYGYIVLKRNIIDVRLGSGLFLLSGFLFTIPNIFGMPFFNIRYQIELEIRILDSENKLVGKYAAVGESSVKVAYYYGYSLRIAGRKAYTDAFITAFDKIRPQIQADALSVNEKLSKAGKFKK